MCAGEYNGVVNDKDHLVYRWVRDDCLILFSVCRKGNGASCHFSSDRRGLRLLGQAINAFVDFVFYAFKWCKMIIAQIEKPSVCRLVKRLGFEHIGSCEGCQIYIKV